MRHDAHYVEELARTHRSIGKVIPIDKIAPNPDQPRTEIGDLTELSDSIRQNGVLEPLLVKPKSDGTWMIIAGERRWRASNLAGLTEVPCIEFDIDEKTIAEIALIENLQRKDLTIWEEADGLAYLAERFGYTHEEIAKKIGKSRTTVTESMALAGLPETIRAKCFAADITAKSTLLEVARQFDEQAMHDFLDHLGKHRLKREEIRRAARPKKDLPEVSAAPPPDSPKADESFRYASTENEFDLEIRFNRGKYDKRDVLRALKEVFDDTKNQI
jgi:ParB family chromosome partitioning protein